MTSNVTRCAGVSRLEPGPTDFGILLETLERDIRDILQSDEGCDT